MMVPMMMPQDAVAGRQAPMAMMNPFMAPQAFMPAQFPAAVTTSAETPAGVNQQQQQLQTPQVPQPVAATQPSAPPATSQAPIAPAPMVFPPILPQQPAQQPTAAMPFAMPSLMPGMPPIMTAMMPQVPLPQPPTAGITQATSNGSPSSTDSGRDKTPPGTGAGNLAHCA